MKLLRAWLAFISALTLVSGVALAQYVRIQDEATNVTRRSTVNFTGPGISCVDTPGTFTTTCTAAGGGAPDSGWLPGDPSNCAAGQYATGINEMGVPTCVSLPTCVGSEVLTFDGGTLSCVVPSNDAGFTLMRADTRRKRRAVHCSFSQYNGTTFNCDQGLSVGVSCSGSCSTANDSEQSWIKVTTSNTAGATAGVNANTMMTQAWYQPRLVAHVKTDSAIDNRKLWVQWTANASSHTSPIPDAGTLSNAYVFGGLGFQVNSSQSWMCCASNGTDVGCNTTGLVVQPSTAYEIELLYTAAGTECTVTTLDGGYGHATQSSYPVSDSTALSILMMVTNQDAGTARSSHVGYYEYETE